MKPLNLVKPAHHSAADVALVALAGVLAATLFSGRTDTTASLAAASAPPIASTTVPPAAVAPAATPAVASFVGDFERGDLSGWQSREAARADSVQVVREPVRRGRWAAQFTVRPGERVSNGNRAEITYDNGDRAGSRVWYAWSFLVPRDFADTEWRPRLWQCLGQWHDQPDRERGETWDKFPGHSPSIAVYYTWKKGVPAIELWYGAAKEQKIVAVAPIRKGEWNDLVFHIGWSPGADGFAEVFLNGQPFTPRSGTHHKVFGPNMWNAASHYLKIGLYRNSEISTTNSVYFDEVRIGSSRQKVAPFAR